jgi:hypothetical protein
MKLPVACAAALLMAAGATRTTPGPPAPAAAPVASNVEQPTLAWPAQPRSDWINVQQNDIANAKGDGKTDDSAALAKILANFSGGAGRMVVYFPPGTYAIGATLAANGTVGVLRARGSLGRILALSL